MAFGILNLVLLTVAFLVGRLFRENPMLFGMRAPGGLPSDDEFYVYKEQLVLDTELNKYATALGDDYEAYRNHCLRVLSFSVYQLGGASNVTAKEVDVMALALAYHDVGLWSDRALDYLEPSVEQLEKQVDGMILDADVKKKQAQERGDDEAVAAIDHYAFDENDLATAREIVLEHHKLTEWQPPVDSKASANLVNAVRKGDWADATMGLVRFGLPASYLEAAYKDVPEAGFHKILAQMGGRLSPGSFLGRLAVLNIFKL